MNSRWWLPRNVKRALRCQLTLGLLFLLASARQEDVVY